MQSLEIGGGPSLADIGFAFLDIKARSRSFKNDRKVEFTVFQDTGDVRAGITTCEVTITSMELLNIPEQKCQIRGRVRSASTGGVCTYEALYNAKLRLGTFKIEGHGILI